jgi:hypothetical protein
MDTHRKLQEITWTPIVTGKITGFADNRFDGIAAAFHASKVSA